MPKNSINDLRNHLFELIEDLKDDDKQVDLNRARMVVEVSKTIIETAKVEVKALELLGGTPTSGFLELENHPQPKQLPGPQPIRKVSGE